MQKVRLIIREIFSGGFITIVVLLSISFSTILLGVFLVIRDTINKNVISQMENSIPPNTIKVSPKKGKGSLLKFIFKHAPGEILSEETLKEFGKFPGVKKIYPVQASHIPMQAVISIFGLTYRTDLICVGVAYDFLDQDIKKRIRKNIWDNWKNSQELPVLIPLFFLEAYNNSMAEPNGLPTITQDMAINREVQIVFGKSSIKTMEGATTEKARVIGFTDKIRSMALVIPLKAVKYYNEKFKGKSSGDEYMNFFIEVKDHSALLSIVKKISGKGFIVETDKSLSREIILLKNRVQAIIYVLSMIVLLLAIIAVSFSILIASLQKIEYYRILRILGASRLFISFIVFLKFSFIGFIGAFAGVKVLEFFSLNFTPSLKIGTWNIGIVFENKNYSLFLSGSIFLSIIATIPSLGTLFTKRMDTD